MNRLKQITTVQAYVALGHLLFLGLFILSLIHFRERVVHVDTAFQFFKWVQGDGVEVEAHRYSAILPQLAVKVFRYFRADLVLLMQVASAAHVLVGWLVFSLAAHLWRVPWVALGCALATVLFTRLTFYGIVLEANYLLCYPFFLAAALQGPMLRQRDRGALALAVLALFAVLLVHPVGFLIALYVLVFFFLVEPRLRGPVSVLVVITLLWALVGRLLLPPSGYESILYAAARDGSQLIGSIGALPSLDFLIGHTWRDTTLYLPAWILAVGMVTALLIQRKWLLLLLVLSGLVGFLLLNILTYHSGEVAMMMEKNFLPVAVLIALPLLHTLFKAPEVWRKAGWVALLFVLFVQFRGISFASRPVSERYTALSDLVRDTDQKGIRKAMLGQEEARRRHIGVVWALPFESFLISGQQGPEHCITIISVDQMPEDSLFSGVVLWPWVSELPADKLRSRYFSSTSDRYQYIGAADQ